MSGPPPGTLAIVGPTASGKSALAMALAGRFPPEGASGAIELVSVDAMQVYRGMDIGTAKPTAADRAAVPHHLIDLLDPHEEASVSWFQAAAFACLDDLGARGVRPVLVGGTGLYHRAVVDGLEIPPRFPDVAVELESEPDTEALHRRLADLDPVAAARSTPTNRRRILRALEVTVGSGRRFSSYGAGLEQYPTTDTIFVGLRVERSDLVERISRRWAAQMDAGLVEEVRALEARPEGWSVTAAAAIGYKHLLAHLRDGAPLAECESAAQLATRRYAARQVRWFRRDPRITWFDASAHGDDDLLAGLTDVVVEHWESEMRRRGRPVGGKM